MHETILKNYDDAATLTNTARACGLLATRPLEMVPVIHGRSGFKVCISTDVAGCEAMKSYRAVRSFAESFMSRDTAYYG